MKRVILGVSAILIISFSFNSCIKHDVLPNSISKIDTIFLVNSSMTHAKDTIFLGDTIFMTAKGKIADTTNIISANFKVLASSNLVGAGYFPKLTRVITPPTGTTGTAALYNWTSTLAIICPSVARKTAVTVSAIFENSLSLSSKMGNQSASDKTGKATSVYIK